ncbi:MAG: hypothetical protein PHH16_01450 [Candidatus Gracilibacteria bacterium]|nr:hypothetical protein [Candidatus Gracilibacteria bacterium]
MNNSDKDYTILLIPEQEVIKKIQDFRIKHIGTDEVDGILYPHITLKRRFRLGEGLTENDLIQLFKSCIFTVLDIHFQSIETYGDALVLKGESEEVRIAHENLLRLLYEKILTKNPEYEGKKYGAHLTLLRFAKDTDIANLAYRAQDLLGTYKIESVVLAEIGVKRNFYRELHSIKI